MVVVIRRIGNSIRINKNSDISLGYKMNYYYTHYALIKNSSSSDFYNIKTLDPENCNFGKKERDTKT